MEGQAICSIGRFGVSPVEIRLGMQTFSLDGWLRFEMKQRSAAIVCLRTARSSASRLWQGRAGQARRLSHNWAGQARRLSHGWAGQARRLSHGTAIAGPNRIAGRAEANVNREAMGGHEPACAR